MEQSNQKNNLKDIISDSLNRLERQLQVEPFESILSGFIFGAGLTASTPEHLRQGAKWIAKVVSSEMMMDVRISEKSEPNP